jgi:hypothetical protein
MPQGEAPNIGFPFDRLPTEQASIRLLTLLPGSGGGQPLECLLTTHTWNAQTGLIHPAQRLTGKTCPSQDASGEDDLPPSRRAAMDRRRCH